MLGSAGTKGKRSVQCLSLVCNALIQGMLAASKIFHQGKCYGNLEREDMFLIH